MRRPTVFQTQLPKEVATMKFTEKEVAEKAIKLKREKKLTYDQIGQELAKEGIIDAYGKPFISANLSKMILAHFPEARLKRSKPIQKHTFAPAKVEQKIETPSLDKFVREKAVEFLLKSKAKDRQVLAELILTAESEE
jgi:hypothetical protein